VDSSDINAYLRDASGEDFTAKDFRTWAGTILAARALQEFKNIRSEAEAKRNIVRAIEAVASRLGNTRAVCRKCYVHPAILDAYVDGTLIEALCGRARTELVSDPGHLSAEEAAVLAFLERRLERDAKSRSDTAAA
jgi:DNA topoisomerase I